MATLKPTKITDSKRSRTNSSTMRKAWPWFFLFAMLVIFTISAKGLHGIDFISYRSVQGILTYATQILIIGIGETIIIIAAGIDLSVHYTLGLSAVVAAVIMRAMYAAQMPPFLTITCGFLGGVLVCLIPGLVNGKLVSKVKVPSPARQEIFLLSIFCLLFQDDLRVYEDFFYISRILSGAMESRRFTRKPS